MPKYISKKLKSRNQPECTRITMQNPLKSIPDHHSHHSHLTRPLTSVTSHIFHISHHSAKKFLGRKLLVTSPHHSHQNCVRELVRKIHIYADEELTSMRITMQNPFTPTTDTRKVQKNTTKNYENYHESCP